MAFAVDENKLFDLVDVGLLSAVTVMTSPDGGLTLLSGSDIWRSPG